MGLRRVVGREIQDENKMRGCKTKWYIKVDLVKSFESSLVVIAA